MIGAERERSEERVSQK